MSEAKTKVRKRKKMNSRKLRFSPEDEARIQMRADMYSAGNFSKWVRYAALECPGCDLEKGGRDEN